MGALRYLDTFPPLPILGPIGVVILGAVVAALFLGLGFPSWSVQVVALACWIGVSALVVRAGLAAHSAQ